MRWMPVLAQFALVANVAFRSMQKHGVGIEQFEATFYRAAARLEFERRMLDLARGGR